MQSLASDHTVHVRTNGISTAIRRMIMRFVIGHLVSRHAKRILFFASLYSRVMRLESLTDEAIEKLNQVMGLARRPDSLKMGHFARELIWDDADIETSLSPELFRNELTPDLTRRISEELVARAPSFIVYGRRADMAKEVEHLITRGSELAAAA